MKTIEELYGISKDKVKIQYPKKQSKWYKLGVKIAKKAIKKVEDEEKEKSKLINTYVLGKKENKMKSTTFIYNYWNNLGTFMFDGYVLKYNWNGYDVPDDLLYNETFQRFFNTISDIKDLNIDGKKFKTENCDKFLEMLGGWGYFFDLFVIAGIKKTDKQQKLENIVNNWM